MKESERRFTNSYKCTTIVYNKAMRRAKKERIPLSQTIEVFVKLYSEGYDMEVIPTKPIKEKVNVK